MKKALFMLVGMTLLSSVSYSAPAKNTNTNSLESSLNAIENKFNDLKLNINGGARGSKACWPVFFTPIPNIHIIHKSNKGFLDLTFRMVSQYKFQVYDIVKNVLKENMTFQQTGKSLAIRIYVPKIDFKKDFEEQEENVIKCLEEVKKMQEFMMKKIDYMEILRLGNN